MFGKKKDPKIGENELPHIGADHSEVEDILHAVEHPAADSDTQIEQENIVKPKKKLFGFLRKKPSDNEAHTLELDAQPGVEAARQDEQSDPLAFLDANAHHDIVIKEITEGVGNAPGKASNSEDELLQTILDSADNKSEASAPASEKLTIPEPIAENPEDNVLANAAELKNKPNNLMGFMKPKTAPEDGVISETETAAPTDESNPENASESSDIVAGTEMPERNMTSLYKSIGLDETLAPGYDPNAARAPEFVTNGEPSEQLPVDNAARKSGLVSAIVQTTKQHQAAQDAVLGEDFAEQLNQEEEEEKLKAKVKRREKMLLASRFVAGISLIVPLFSWIIISSLLTPSSRFSEILNSRNYGAELAGVKAKKEEKDITLKKLGGEIAKLKQDTENIKDNKILKQALDGRIDFLEIMLRINKITLKALNLTPELNNAIHMLVFNSYTGRMDGDKVQVSITGSVRDPKRLSISKLTQLIESINADEYFEGAALRSFSKSNDEEGGSQSSFSLSFSYFPDADKALNDSLAGAPANAKKK